MHCMASNVVMRFTSGTVCTAIQEIFVLHGLREEYALSGCASLRAVQDWAHRAHDRLSCAVASKSYRGGREPLLGGRSACEFRQGGLPGPRDVTHPAD